ncbi:MAG: hypothetical protein WC668_04215 [Patescibacteria group bacterium]|jgi:hypothetical protein
MKKFFNFKLTDCWKIFNPSQGFVLVTSIFVMLLLLSLGLFVASFVLTELHIANSQAASVQNYYLAESGVAEAVWRVKNDAAWKTQFESEDDWNIIYTRSAALYDNGSYTINIKNSLRGRGEVNVTSTLALSGGSSRRVIKTLIYKALGESLVGNNGEYADGNIDMSGSNLAIVNGGFFSNLNVIINFWSTIDADKQVQAVGNINIGSKSALNATEIHSHNINPPAPDPLAMPAVSFDNPGDPDSYKAKADHIYTTSQFDSLLWDNRGGTLTLDGITYVTGDVSIRGNNNLIINGVLAADGDIELGANTLLCCWGLNCGRSHITINRVGSTTPAGILSKQDVSFELCLDSFSGTGLVYANDKINILSLPNSIGLTGGLISRKITLTSIWQPMIITYDNSVVNYTLGDPQFSPIVTVEHWEEEY